MHSGRFIFFTWFCFFLTYISEAQDSTAERKLLFNGYIKSLQSFTFDHHFENLVYGNLLHNRLNLKWKPSATWTAAVELRNRIYWGEEVRREPRFAELLENPNDLADLSHAWIRSSSLVAHTNIERLWMEYRREKWNLRIGRQRINWGMATLWNPNDLFNFYNFLDIDYEERPGTDALKGQYHFSVSTNLEAVIAANQYHSIGALRLFTNKWNYDFQGIAGWYNDQLTAGGGWAGSIKKAGFKGEFQYFASRRLVKGQLNLVLEGDYMLERGWYVNAGGLFNSLGIDHPLDDWKDLNLSLSPQNPLPVKWAVTTMAAKEFTPLFSANMRMVYAPGVHLAMILPAARYNLAENLDLDITWQSFFLQMDKDFTDVAHRGFFRVKWSF